MKRQIGEIFISGKSKEARRYIKTQSGIVNYAVYIAKNNPDICGEWFEGCEVHHKDFNKLNDTPENLICLTSLEHHKLHTKQIIGWYNDEIIGVWHSMTAASNDTGCSIPSISHYCKHNYSISSTWKDYKWQYVDNYLADWWDKEMDKCIN